MQGQYWWKEGTSELISTQLKKAVDKIQEEHQSWQIMIWKTYWANGKWYVAKKDLLPKLVTGACQILEGWKHQYSNRNKRLNEANEGITFANKVDKDKKAISKRNHML